ncbi:MAG: LysR family transcriptional regulator [Clostridiaceae bacterium]|nr:LysR family transcriptional regulator [Clostridiaceae bacterium]
MIDHRIETLLIMSETLSYTKTAELLHLTQPAVSQHIRYLEKQYNCKLFEQYGRRIKLTPAGDRLVSAARVMQANSRRIAAELNAIDPSRPLLRLGATKTIGNYVIARPLAEFIKIHPEYDLELTVDNTYELLNGLDTGMLDLLFLEGNFDKQHYRYQLFRNEDFIGICSPENTISRQKTARMEDILSQRLIIREQGSGTREIFEQQLQQRSFSLDAFQNTITISQFSVIKELVAENIGISFVYRSVASRELSEGRLCEFSLTDSPHSHEFSIVRLPASVLPPEIDAFTDFISGNYGSCL